MLVKWSSPNCFKTLCINAAVTLLLQLALKAVRFSVYCKSKSIKSIVTNSLMGLVEVEVEVVST